MNKQFYLFIITIFFTSFCFGQSKWKDHLGEYHPFVELKADFPLIQSFPYDHKLKPTLTVPSMGMPEISIMEGDRKSTRLNSSH